MSLLQAINDAEEELTKEKGWATNQFPVNIATSYSDDTPKQIDIMITLGHKTRHYDNARTQNPTVQEDKTET